MGQKFRTTSILGFLSIGSHNSWGNTLIIVQNIDLEKVNLYTSLLKGQESGKSLLARWGSVISSHYIKQSLNL